MSVLFITVEKLVSETPLNGTVDTSLASPIIKTAQDVEVWPYLGTDLYNRLKADVEASTVSGVYATLLKDYIQPCLVWYGFSHLLPFLRLRLVNNAVQIMSSEQSEPASYQDVDRLVDQAQNWGAFFRERMIEYLCENSVSFPEYSSNTGADLNPRSQNYSGGMFLGHTYNRKSEQFLRDAGLSTN